MKISKICSIIPILPLNPNANDKIVFVLSKETGFQVYEKIEYEISKGIVSSLASSFSDDIEISPHILKSVGEANVNSQNGKLL